MVEQGQCLNYEYGIRIVTTTEIKTDFKFDFWNKQHTAYHVLPAQAIETALRHFPSALEGEAFDRSRVASHTEQVVSACQKVPVLNKNH